MVVCEEKKGRGVGLVSEADEFDVKGEAARSVHVSFVNSRI